MALFASMLAFDGMEKVGLCSRDKGRTQTTALMRRTKMVSPIFKSSLSGELTFRHHTHFFWGVMEVDHDNYKLYRYIK